MTHARCFSAALIGLVTATLAGCHATHDRFVALFPDEGPPSGWVVRAWDDVSKPVGDEVRWVVRDGVLSTPTQRGTWLMSEAAYGDFVLEFEIKLTERGNSGVALRSPLDGDPAFDGMEFQVADLRYNTGAKPSELTGGVYRAIAPGVPSEAVYVPVGWNAVRIELVGARLRATLNGRVVQDVDLSEYDQPIERHDGTQALPIKDRPGRGHLGFQHLSRNNEPVFIRNARIKVLAPVE